MVLPFTLMDKSIGQALILRTHTSCSLLANRLLYSVSCSTRTGFREGGVVASSSVSRSVIENLDAHWDQDSPRASVQTESYRANSATQRTRLSDKYAGWQISAADPLPQPLNTNSAVYKCVFVYVYVYVCVCIYIYIYLYIYIYIYICMFIIICRYMYIYIYIYIYIYTYIYIQISIYSYTYLNK